MLVSVVNNNINLLPSTYNRSQFDKIDTSEIRRNLNKMAARKEILFDGYFYDVTDFIMKHPGGTVINYYTEKGEDSTHAIQQFHARSIEKVKVMMGALKKRPASDSESN